MGIVTTACLLYLKDHPEATARELVAYIRGIEDIPPLEPQCNNNINYKPRERKRGVGKKEGDNSVRARRGARIPENFHVTEEMQDWACIKEGLPLDLVRRQTEYFVDYWSGETGARAWKCDWNKAWRNWIRKVADGRPQIQRAESDEEKYRRALEAFRSGKALPQEGQTRNGRFSQ